MGYFISKIHFEEDGAQSYLLFKPIKRYFIIIANSKLISTWQPKGLSNETIKTTTTSDNSLNPLIGYYGSKVRAKFSKGCLKQPNKLRYDYQRKVNIYIAYELGASSSNNSDPTLKIVYLVQLLWQKTQILKIMGILVMELDPIEDQAFHFLVVDSVKMY